MSERIYLYIDGIIIGYFYYYSGVKMVDFELGKYIFDNDDPNKPRRYTIADDKGGCLRVTTSEILDKYDSSDKLNKYIICQSDLYSYFYETQEWLNYIETTYGTGTGYEALLKFDC